MKQMASPTSARTRSAIPGAESQLRSFIAKFDAANQRLIRSVRRTMQKRLPTAVELVYDNYNFFVIGYSPTERPSDAVLSIAAGANGVSLCLLHGARLPDPTGILLGSGSQTRFIRVPSPNVLDERAVEALIAAAVRNAKIPFAKTGRGKLVVKSVSAKQRPRKKASRHSPS